VLGILGASVFGGTEPWTPYDGVPVVYGNSPPVVYDTIYPKRVKS